MSAATDPAALIGLLKQHIARLENSSLMAAPGRGQRWVTGLEALDGHLPGHGLARAGLHAIAPAACGDMPAAMGFATALALVRFACGPEERRPLLWVRDGGRVREYGRLYGHGLVRLGLPRERFLTVTLRQSRAALWTIEEALKSGALALVAGDADPASLSLLASRRLVLAAAAGRSACLLVMAGPAAAAGAHSRWRVSSLASRPPALAPGVPGGPAWTIELLGARGGRPGLWQVEWNRETHRFHMVSGVSGGALHPYADEDGAGAAGRPGPALRAG